MCTEGCTSVKYFEVFVLAHTSLRKLLCPITSNQLHATVRIIQVNYPDGRVRHITVEHKLLYNSSKLVFGQRFPAIALFLAMPLCLAGDIEANPGPSGHCVPNAFRCLSFNARRSRVRSKYTTVLLPAI